MMIQSNLSGILLMEDIYLQVIHAHIKTPIMTLMHG